MHLRYILIPLWVNNICGNYEADWAVDLTAAGNEAVLQCESGSYCCDTNRPDPGCCVTSTSRFQLSSLPFLFPDGSPGGGTDNGGGGGASSSTAQQATTSSSTAVATVAATSSTPPPSVTPQSVTPPSSTPPSSTPPSSTPPSSTPPSDTPTPVDSTTSSTSKSSTSPTSSSSTSATVSSSPIISILTSIVTEGGTPSTLVTSQSSDIVVPIPATPTPSPATASSSKSIGSIIGPAVGVPVAVLGLAAFVFFLFWRSKRSRKDHPSPRNLQSTESPHSIYSEPKPPVESPPYAGKQELEGSPRLGGTSPSTAPPSYRGSTLLGTAATQHPRSPHTSELQGSPTVGTFRDSRGSELVGSPGTGYSTSPRQAELPSVGEGGDPASELAGSTYRPYRPPGWSGG
ncbi:hypothetical protein OEA41_003610 [Lepraria neglecta]|uniref:Uncharacterized protein n=1 Tax=Lepraria neglecta TaxID=209136 RepID=A0AAD9Z4Z6_9LECA|nr:hypothetical protein OEA41_003610 [Lepraria neglecta]